MSSCSQNCEPITGEWKVETPFYKASMEILSIDGALKCAVLTYDDGTSRYNNAGKSPYYLANDLKCKGGEYVDGISGATPTKNQGLRIEPKARDTLLVTSYVMNKPLIEKWIKLEHENN